MGIRRTSLVRQIVGGIGWTIAILGAAAFAGLIVFTDMHREVYERVPTENLLGVGLIVVLGVVLLVVSRRVGRKN
jgi:hypothetical protein